MFLRGHRSPTKRAWGGFAPPRGWRAGGAAGPVATERGGPPPPNHTRTLGGGARPAAGAPTFTGDGMVSSGGTSSEYHQRMSLTVHLVIQGDGPVFEDAGSTYTLSETTLSDTAPIAPDCGDHSESTGAGSGAFTKPEGRIGALYGNYDPPDVQLSFQAPYLRTSSGHIGCLPISGTDHENLQPSCNDPAGGALIGIVEPGIVQPPAPGQIIDFTCIETSVLGQGRVTVTGTLTSR